MSIKSKLVSVIFISALLFSGCDTGSKITDAIDSVKPSSPSTPAASAPAPSPAPAPAQNVELDTTVTTIDGERIRVKATDTGYILEGHEGKVVLLELYSTSCSHCIAAIPMYNRLQAKYGDKLIVLSIEGSGVSDATLQAFAKNNGISYRTVTTANAGPLVSYIMNNGGYQGGVPFLTVVDINGNTYTYITGDVAESTLVNMFIDLTN